MSNLNLLFYYLQVEDHEVFIKDSSLLITDANPSQGALDKALEIANRYNVPGKLTETLIINIYLTNIESVSLNTLENLNDPCRLF